MLNGFYSFLDGFFDVISSFFVAILFRLFNN